VDYYYKSVNGSEDMPLGLPVTPTPGLALTRWVLSAWSISNLSAPAGLVDSTMQRVEQLINNFTRMSPGQVQLSATANVTVPYVLRGIADWTPAATAAMKQAASDAVGGYDPAFITVLLEPPDFGVRTAEFLDSKPAPVTTVSNDRQIVFYSVSSSSKRRYHRKLLQQTGRSAAATSNSKTGMPWGVDGPVQQGRTSNASEWTHVWVSYHRLDPLNVTVLLESLSAACGDVGLLRGADVTATPCGQHTQQLLQQAGVQVDVVKYAEYLKTKPMVSVSVRLAVGVTEQQAESNTDTLVALWLAQPRNIAGAINMSGLPDPIGPNALIKWIVTPEIWGAQVPPSPATPGNPAGLGPGAIAGITIGSAAFAALAVGMIIMLMNRRSEQSQLADKSDLGSDTSSRRRRRRRPAKPRYLLPDLPPAMDGPATAAPTGQGATTEHASSSTSDDQMSPDQIRPAMKELGDSVTSAARFELEDGDATNEHATGDAAAGLAAATTGSRVLAAREALLAEQHLVTPEARDDLASSNHADLISNRGGWQPASTSTVAAVEQLPHAKLSSPFDNDTHPVLLVAQNSAQHESLASQVGGLPGREQVLSTVPLVPGLGPVSVSNDTMHQQAPSTASWQSPQSWSSRSSLPSPCFDNPQEGVSPMMMMVSRDGDGIAHKEDSVGKKDHSVQGIGVVSMKVSKSPFVRSYDFSQLASEVPGIDMISSAFDPCTTSGSRPTSTTSTHELHDIGSTQLSVAADGHFVVHAVDGTPCTNHVT
jgi:hypothetical protein